MQHIFRNITIGLILCSFLLYTCGVHLFYETAISQTKQENYIAGKPADKKHELKQMRVPLSEITWEHEYEFKWRGEMYDVSSKRIEGDTLVCMAYHDVKEKKLNDRYAAHQEEHAGNSKNTTQSVKTIQPFLQQVDIQFANEGAGFYLMQIVEVAYISHKSETISPPPEV